MLKPQIWIPNGYTGDFSLGLDEEWRKFEGSYLEFIQFFPKLGEKMDVALFCIGAE